MKRIRDQRRNDPEKVAALEAKRAEARRLAGDGYPHKEIAQILGVYPDTVKIWCRNKRYIRKADRVETL